MAKSKMNKTEIDSMIDENQELISTIQSLHSEGKSKDEIFMVLFSKQVVPSRMDRLWKESGVSSRKTGSGYRQRTCEMFVENDGNVTQEEWEKEMIDGGFLKKIDNYKQHFVVYKALWDHKTMG